MYTLARYIRSAGPALAILLASSLLLAPLPPASGVDGVADHPAKYSACVGAAAESAGFHDMVGNFAEEAANCLAHYRITYGTALGVFSPTDIVPRWQMALFLVRAAKPAGIVVPRATDQGFADLGSFASHIQEGINQLAALGIMPGTTETVYEPGEPVTRQQMALLMARFLEAAPTGPGGTDIDSIGPDDNKFRDLRDVPFTTYRAIRKIYEMGVTEGTSATTFSPDGWVTRAQMAVFITRMLAHTNARPTGLTAQTFDNLVFKESTIELSISVRDTTHNPFVGRAVDVFVTVDPSKAFDDDGLCTAEAFPADGASECKIDVADEETDLSGNLILDVEVGEVDSQRIWAWTGEPDEVFNRDSTAFLALDVNTRPTASALKVSDDLPESATKVPFGQSVTFVFQLVDDSGDPVPKENVRFVVEVQESRDNGRRVEQTTLSKLTGPDGSAQATFLNKDPSEALGDVALLDLDIRKGGDLEVRDETAVGIVGKDGTSDDASLEWSDEQAEPTTLDLSVVSDYLVASSSGHGAAATVLALLTDQYGGPVSREQVVFSSNDSRGVPNGVRRATDSNGVASLNYLRDSDEGFTERITGRFGQLTSTTRQHWVIRLSDSADGSGTVRQVDADADTVIVETGTDILLIVYDANDQFNVGRETSNVSEFENQLTVGDTLSYQIADTDPRTVNSFTLTNR